MSDTANGPIAKPNCVSAASIVLRICAFFQHELALPPIRRVDAVADEAFPDARDDRQLAKLLRNRKRGGQRIRDWSALRERSRAAS